MIELILPPLFAGLALSSFAGPLGCFMVWRRMAFFGDAIAHGALLGAALGLLLQLQMNVAVMAVACLSALALTLARRYPGLPQDAVLAVISQGSLAFGLLLIGLQHDLRVDLMSLLLGDLLTVTYVDVTLIGGWAVFALTIIALFWRKLLLMIVDPDLARAEGFSVQRLSLMLMLLIACSIAIAIKIVGVLLIAAMMVIPATAARLLCRSPEAMVLIASVLSALSVCLGLTLSYFADAPAGPAIVCAAVCLLFTCAIPSTLRAS